MCWSYEVINYLRRFLFSFSQRNKDASSLLQDLVFLGVHTHQFMNDSVRVRMALLNQQHYLFECREEQQTLFKSTERRGNLSSGTVKWDWQGGKQTTPKPNLSQLVTTSSGHICHLLCFTLSSPSSAGGWPEHAGTCMPGHSWHWCRHLVGVEGLQPSWAVLAAVCGGGWLWGQACRSCPAAVSLRPVPAVLPELCISHPQDSLWAECLESNGDSALHPSTKDLITDF